VRIYPHKTKVLYKVKNKTMKIVLLAASELPVIGGREIVVHYLAKTLRQLGHQVRLTGPAGWWKNRHTKLPYPVHRWPTLRGYFPDQVNLARILVDTFIFGADVIHAHSTFPPGFTACRLKRFNNIPVILTPHGEDIHMVPEICRGLRLDPKKEPKIRYAVQHADVLTAISKSIKDSMLDAGADPSKIVMIPNGTDAERYASAVNMNVNKWLRIESDAKIILAVGNYRLCKGYEILFEAMHDILKNQPKARIVIAGRDKAQKLAGLIDQHKLHGKVILTGEIKLPQKVLGIQNGENPADHQEDLLAALYQSADVYVSAGVSDGAEGLSLAILDALTAKLPVVATNISGNKDIIKDGHSGILVESGNPVRMAEAIVYLLKNPSVAKDYGKIAYEISHQYHWQSVANRYMEVYRKAIAQQNHKRHCK
jgi:glycosyltransferase involved in cell wall biosynthesis